MSLLLFMLSGNVDVSKSAVILGDSTMASTGRLRPIAEGLFTDFEIADGYSAYSLAVAGNTISDQLTAWQNYENKLQHKYIFIQVGLNDMNNDSSIILSDYQNLINQIKSTKSNDALIIASCMLPCKQRFIDLNWSNGQSNWESLNNAIMTSIVNVDYRNNYHVSLLGDGSGNLATQYDSGDHIHENELGANIIRDGFRLIIGI